MKSIFKHSAIAVIVSFGLSGCFLTGSSDTANKESTPTPVTQPSTTEVAKKLDKNGEEWRHIRVAYYGFNRTYLVKPQGKSKTTSYDTLSNYYIYWEGTDEASDNYHLNLAELGQGKSEGSVNLKMNLVSHGTTYPDPDNKDTKFNYIVINQPYSSYGVLFVGDNPEFAQKPFYLGQKAATVGANDYENAEYTVGKYNTQTQEISWNKEVEGSATYKGDVIKVNIGGVTFDKPTVDGTITLKANFVNGVEKSTISAELDSKTVGKVNFEKAENGFDGIIRENGSFYFKDPEHLLTGKFVGKDFNDAVGRIQVLNSDYEAVFGATKQK